MADATIVEGGEYTIQGLNPRHEKYNGRRVLVEKIGSEDMILTKLLNKEPGELSGFIVGEDQLTNTG